MTGRICAIINAAGDETRMRPLNLGKSKTLIDLQGRPFIQLLSYSLSPHFHDVYIYTRADIAPELLKLRLPRNVHVEVSLRQGNAMDLIALSRDRPYDSYVSMCNDTITDVDFGVISRTDGDFIATTSWPEAQNFGKILVRRHDNLIMASLEEDGAAHPGDLSLLPQASTGIVKLQHGVVAGLPGGFTSLEKQILPYLIKQGRVVAIPLGEAFCLDYGDPARFAKLPGFADVIERIYDEPMRRIAAAESPAAGRHNRPA